MLTAGELDRIRAELGYHLLNTGAQPFIGVHQVFEQIVQPFLREGLDTTATTGISAETAGMPVNIMLASITGIVVHSRLALDVDGAIETVTVRSVDAIGSAVSVIANSPHFPPFPVTVDAGLQIVRENLANIFKVKQRMAAARGTGALKQVDEIQFYGVKEKSGIKILMEQLTFWRQELANCLGVPMNFAAAGGTNGGSIGLY